MREIKVKKLNLENFKGRNMTVEFKGGITEIRGTNEAGKSTVTNGYFWLLTGVDSKDRTNYDLFDSTKEFTHENAIPAVVEGTFTIDGIEKVLKRTAKQKWTRPRGKEEYVKDKSDEYLYYIDGLAVSAKAYKDFIEQTFAPIDKLKLMLNVRYYEMLDWKVLRKHFADLVGEIKPEELKGDYSSIAELLEKYETTEKVREYLRQSINPAKRELDGIEAEIKGMQNMLPDISGVADAEIEYAKNAEKIKAIDAEIVGLGDANKPFIEKRNAELQAIAEKKAELELKRIEWDSVQNSNPLHLKKEIARVSENNEAIAKENNRIRQEEASNKRQIEATQQQIDFLKEELDRLRMENAEIKARTFNEDLKCPTCGQQMPAGEIEAARQKFYDKREQDHKTCVERGLKTKESLARQEELLAELKTKTFILQEYCTAEGYQKEYDEAISKIIPFENSEDYSKLTNEMTDMENNLTVIPKVNSEELQEEKATLQSRQVELQEIIAFKSAREKGERKIAEREECRDKIGAELARLEGLEFKCIEREREWASIIRDRANKNLTYAHVEMTEQNKSGEIVDICSLSAREVSASGTNTATQVLIGVDVAKAFQKYADLNLPIFIDNAEQIVSGNLPKVDGQLVVFYVDENYKSLTVL